MKQSPAKTFRELVVWQKAHAFTKKNYFITEKFPKSELYGLVSQFRRAAVSIPANIAEGFARATIKDKIRFLTIAKGSLEECRYYLILSEEIGYAKTETLMHDLNEVC